MTLVNAKTIQKLISIPIILLLTNCMQSKKKYSPSLSLLPVHPAPKQNQVQTIEKNDKLNIQLGPGYLQLTFLQLKNNEVDYNLLEVCSVTSKQCTSKKIYQKKHLYLFSAKDNYKIRVLECFTNKNCQTMWQKNNVMAMSLSPKQLYLSDKITEEQRQRSQKDKILVHKLQKLKERFEEKRQTKDAKALDQIIKTDEDPRTLLANLSAKRKKPKNKKQAKDHSFFFTSVGAVLTGTGVYMGMSSLFETLSEDDFYFRSSSPGDGLIKAPDSMLIGDDLAFWNHHLQKNYPRLITMQVEERTLNFMDKNGYASLSPDDLDGFKRSLRDELITYFKKAEGYEKLPILAFNVNHGNYHWETIVIDLEELRSGSVNFEHWNFTGAGSSNPYKIGVIEEAVTDVLRNLPEKNTVSIRGAVETMSKTADKPRLQDIVDRVKSMQRASPEITSKIKVEEIHDAKDPYVRVTYEGDIYEVRAVDKPNEFFDHKWEIEIPVFQEELIGQNRNYQFFRQGIQEADAIIFSTNLNSLGDDLSQLQVKTNYHANLHQATNNCGVASAWIAEERVRGRTAEEILDVKTKQDGFTSYRNTMLETLHREEVGRYSRASYLDDLKLPEVPVKATNPEVPTNNISKKLSGTMLAASLILAALGVGAMMYGNSLDLVQDPDEKKLRNGIDDLVEEIADHSARLQLLKNRFMATTSF